MLDLAVDGGIIGMAMSRFGRRCLVDVKTCPGVLLGGSWSGISSGRWPVAVLFAVDELSESW